MKKTDFNRKLQWCDDTWGKDRCWPWFPPEIDEHRQRISVGGRKLLVHRYAYEYLFERGRKLPGPLKKNQPLVKTCNGPRCINPYHHMPAVSRKALVEAGEWSGIEPNDPRGAHNRDKTRCPYGHLYTAENTCHTNGRRRCLACKRERAWLPLEKRWIVHGFRDEVRRMPGVPLPLTEEDLALPDRIEPELPTSPWMEEGLRLLEEEMREEEAARREGPQAA